MERTQISRREIYEGSYYHLECPRYQNALHYRWFTESGEEIYSETVNRGLYRLPGEKNRRLRVRVTPETEGIYRCRAVTGFGSREHLFSLQIKEKTKRDTYKPALMKETMTNHSLDPGDRLGLLCRLQTMQNLRIKWQIETMNTKVKVKL